VGLPCHSPVRLPIFLTILHDPVFFLFAHAIEIELAEKDGDVRVKIVPKIN
jgi:hypothetical protein